MSKRGEVKAVRSKLGIVQMPKITRSSDCGHSPKNQLLEEFAIARVTNDSSALDRLLSSDATWTIAGQPPIVGKEAVMNAIKKMRAGTVTELTILHVAQHGKIGAVNGQMRIRGGNRIDFCDMCEFASAKGTLISAITSYIIEH